MLSRLNLKLILLFAILANSVDAQKLDKADSLFAQQKYTEALEIYESTFSAGQSSPAMLLKMAFIKEGLGDYAEALYYLDLYYKESADRSAVGKIKQLSETNDLLGYNYDDTHFFRSLLTKYRLQVQLVLSSVLVLLTAYIYTRRKNQSKPFIAFFFQLLVVGGLLFTSYELSEVKEGIIKTDQTLLRSGPSAGAEPIELISKGHKVDVLEELPAWTKISWDGEEVYVRKGRVRII